MAGKRSIDEVAVRRLLEELYPERLTGNGTDSAAAEAEGTAEKGTGSSAGRGGKIRELLHKFSGSREKSRPGHGNQQGNAVAPHEEVRN